MSEILDAEQNAEVMESFEEDFGKKAVEDMKEKEKQYKPVFDRFVDIEENEHEEDIGSSKEALDFGYITKLADDNTHLTGFDLMDNDLGIDGDVYRYLKKALYYYQHSLRQDTVSYRINHKTVVDNRNHILTIATPGIGKSTIKNQIKRIMKDYEEEDGVIETSSVSHPEQLVGKIVYEGRGDKKTPKTKLGLLGYRSFINDEAQEMLNERNDVYAKAQRLKRLAMDTYKENAISKKLVADSPKDTLEYNPKVRICDFAHPDKLESAFFDTGSFRRYFAFNIDYDDELKLNEITNFSFDDEYQNNHSWKDYLDELYSEQTDVIFDEQTLKIVSHFHECLLYFLLKHKNPNAFRYGLQTRYSLRTTFCKQVLILAKSKKEDIPSLHTTLSACADTILFVLKSIETYNELGNMGATADVWGGCCEQDAEALEYLLRKKALSKDSSSVSIKKFQTILANFYGCKTTQARSHHYRLKRNGFVESKQEGKYNSKVWLKFIPKDINLNSKSYNPFEFWDSLFKGVGLKNTLLTALKSMFTDDKDFEKAKGDGGVGVMGCVLLKTYICVEVYGDKNKNNIYKHIIPPNTGTLDTLEQNTQIYPSKALKPTIQGIKPPQNPVAPLKSKRDEFYYNAKEQFDETEECEYIKPVCKKEEVLDFIKRNPKYDYESLYEKFGTGCLKFRNELKREGLI